MQSLKILNNYLTIYYKRTGINMEDKHFSKLLELLKEASLDNVRAVGDNIVFEKPMPKMLRKLIGNGDSSLTPAQREALFIWLNRREIPQA
jgi:hypothetical protein